MENDGEDIGLINVYIYKNGMEKNKNAIFENEKLWWLNFRIFIVY